MNVSELIEKLKVVQEVHGDVKVYLQVTPKEVLPVYGKLAKIVVPQECLLIGQSGKKEMVCTVKAFDEDGKE